MDQILAVFLAVLKCGDTGIYHYFRSKCLRRYASALQAVVMRSL